MPGYSFKGSSGYKTYIDYGVEYQPGSLPPSGYNGFFDWADVQEKAGLKQEMCSNCCLWKYPQEMYVSEQYEYVDARTGDTVLLWSPKCRECCGKDNSTTTLPHLNQSKPIGKVCGKP